METLGHSQISLTLNTYSHVLPELQLEAAAKLHGVANRGGCSAALTHRAPLTGAVGLKVLRLSGVPRAAAEACADAKTAGVPLRSMSCIAMLGFSSTLEPASVGLHRGRQSAGTGSPVAHIQTRLFR